MTSIKSRENIVLENIEDINKEVVDFFTELLSKDQSLDSRQQDTLMNYIPQVISDNQNPILYKPIMN